jgi:hypothetical protein
MIITVKQKPDECPACGADEVHFLTCNVDGKIGNKCGRCAAIIMVATKRRALSTIRRNHNVISIENEHV